jgi:hypothetical protein
MGRTAFVVVVVVFCTVIAIRGEERAPRVRTADRHLRALVDAGIAQSASLRALVARLEAADVVVYLRCAPLPAGLDGQLTFVSAVGGLRYVLVQVAGGHAAHRTISTLGHELQHAVEIAERPAIVDGASLAREYGRFGVPGVAAGRRATAFDSAAAIDAGQRIWRELAAFGAADE